MKSTTYNNGAPALEGSLESKKKGMQNVPYDLRWPEEFARIKGQLAKHLSGCIVGIEHVGSTAVPGLPAKPVIDLDVVIESSSQLQEVIERLGELGYSHQGDLGKPGREAFTRNDDDQVPYDGKNTVWIRHHLYVCVKDGIPLRDHLAFRDYLLNHPETAREYAALKDELGNKCQFDPEAYVTGKTRFVEEVLSKALSNNSPLTND